MRQQKFKVDKPSANFFLRAGNGDLSFRFGRTADISKECAALVPSDISSFFRKVPEGHLQLFRDDVAVQALHVFTGFSVTESASSEARFVQVDGTTATFARLDAYIATVTIYFQADGPETVSSHIQKLYNETFLSFLHIALSQLVNQIGAYVEQWCAETVPLFLAIDRKEEHFSDPIQRRGTVEVLNGSLRQRVIAVSCQWLSEFLTFAVGTIDDCTMLESEIIKQKLIPPALF